MSIQFLQPSLGQSEGEFCGPNNQCDEGLRCEQETIITDTECFLFIFCEDEEPLNQLICRVGENPPSVPIEDPVPFPGTTEPTTDLEQHSWCFKYIDEAGNERPCDLWKFLVISFAIVLFVTAFVIIIIFG